MQRKTIHESPCHAHEYISPVVVIVAGTRCNLIELVAVIVAAICLIAAVEVAVILRTAVAAAAPALVTDTKIFQFPRFLAAILLAQLCHRSRLGSDILDPFGEFLDRPAADVAAKIRLRAEHLTEIEELMSSKGIILDRTTPVVIDHTRTERGVSDTILPVILIGEATARPTHHRHAQFLEGVEHICAVTVDIGYLRISADP